jgi:glycine/D-amino acid oxidase-like deaminating enzyme
VPARGMAALPAHLLTQLRPGTVRLGVAAEAVTGTTVRTTDGTLTARSVVVATDPGTAARLVPAVPAPRMRAVTTTYHVTEDAPDTRPLLRLDGTGGPLLNSVVLTAAAPSYSPDHRALVSTSALGSAADVPEPVVRRELARVWGVDTSHWQHLHTSEVPAALPALTAPTAAGLRAPVDLGDGLHVAGDHRDTPSLQGAMASGRRTARSVDHGLRR